MVVALVYISSTTVKWESINHI